MIAGARLGYFEKVRRTPATRKPPPTSPKFMARDRQPRHRFTSPPGPPRGVTAPEVIVVVLILFLALMVVLFTLPRQRENARMAGCRRNLMQVGVALALYDRSEGWLPTVPAPLTSPPGSGGPLKAFLESLKIPDLTDLSDVSKPPEGRPGEVPGERPIPGMVCPSDPYKTSPGGFPAPVSYRATTGDSPDGRNGGFAPGRTIRVKEIEDGDGRSFTAAFSERLLGTGRADDPRPPNYRTVPGPLRGTGCRPPAQADWRGDAGSSWAEASWRSTLYNHALPPDAAPSCVAADGASAFMGASSGHVGGVNVLFFDGSVRTVSPRVDPRVWMGMATTHGSGDPTSAHGPPAPTAPDQRGEPAGNRSESPLR